MATQSSTLQAQRGGIVPMLLFWILLMAVGTWWIHGGLEDMMRPNANIVHTLPAGEPVTLQRNRAGHYEAPGRINGQPVTFLLDTGATYVAVPATLASELGLEPGRSAWFNTANGRVEGALTQLEEVSLGGLRVQNVQGSISPGMESDTVLLGMSFLNLLSIEMQAGEMVLSLPAQ
jgi:aspartyl protease family protein